MVWKILTLVIMGTLGVSNAFGDSVYSKYFAGDLKIPDLKANLDSLIQYDHAACGDLVRQEVQLINEYGIEAAGSQRSEAKDASHRIHVLFKQAKDTPNRPCLETAFRIYAVGSVFLLDPSNYNVPKVMIGQGVTSTSTFSAMDGSVQVSALSNLPLTYLTAALANRNKFSFFAEPVETSPVNGDKPREILGAYDCSNSTLYLDPWLPPLDLGATLLHELDHLFLDKKFSKEALQAEFANADGKINWRAYVLEDEFAAITHSAIAQREMYVLPRKYWQWTLWGSPYTFQWSKLPYQLDADLRLFSRDGAIASLELMFEPGSDTETLLALATARNVEMTGKYTGLQFSKIGSTDPDVLGRFDKAAARIIDIVNAPYFGNSPLTDSDRSLLKADRHGLELTPLPAWIQAHDLSVSPLIGDSTAKTGSLVFTGPTNYFTSDNKPITRIEFSGMDALLSGIDEVITSMDRPTDVCKLYLDAISLGELDQYIGTQIQLDSAPDDGANPGAAGARPGAAGARPGAAGARPGAAGARPGAAGARPGAAGARPGAAGARPGAAGARPGAAGARPGAGLMRPCLSLTHEL